VGVIGVGQNGSNLAERISKLPGARLAALADPDPAYHMQALKEKLAGRKLRQCRYLYGLSTAADRKVLTPSYRVL
jgi:predicted homoserine dehydrogenase-like protein